MMKHFRICGASSLIEKTFAAIGAMVSIGALGYLACKKCNLCKNGCHCHGEIGDATGAPEVTMDFQVNPKQDSTQTTTQN